MLRPNDPSSTSRPIRTAGRAGRPVAGRGSGAGEIALRTDAEIAAIAEAGRVLAAALEAGRGACRVGARTAEIARVVEASIREAGAEPALLGLVDADTGRAFPAAATVSVEDVVLHGVPGERRLLDGELLSIDAAVSLDGWHADAAITVPVGKVDATRSRLATAVHDLLDTAIDLVRPGVRWSRIARILQEVALGSGYGLVEGFVGHGIGRSLHEAPAVPGLLTRGLLGRGDFTLRPGMVLAIEPVIVAEGAISGTGLRGDGTAAGVPVVLDADDWSVRTLDGAVAAHAEHTIAVGSHGAVVLTDPSHRHLIETTRTDGQHA